MRIQHILTECIGLCLHLVYLRRYPSIELEGLRKTEKSLS